MSTDQPKYLWGKPNPKYTGPKAAQKMDSDQATRGAASSDFSSQSFDRKVLDPDEASHYVFSGLIEDTLEEDTESLSRLNGVGGVFIDHSGSSGKKYPFDSDRFFVIAKRDTLDNLSWEYHEHPEYAMPDEDGYYDSTQESVAKNVYDTTLRNRKVHVDFRTDDPIMNQAIYNKLDYTSKLYHQRDDNSKKTNVVDEPQFSLGFNILADKGSNTTDNIIRISQGVAEGNLIDDQKYDNAATQISSNMRKKIERKYKDFTDEEEAQIRAEKDVLSHLGVSSTGDLDDTQRKAIDLMSADYLEGNRSVNDSIKKDMMESADTQDYINSFDKETYQKCVEMSEKNPTSFVKEPSYYLIKASKGK